MGILQEGFFSDPELTVEIAEANLELIERFAYILHKLTSSEATDLVEFQTYIFETAQLYVRLYPWYYMPVTVHKILQFIGKLGICMQTNYAILYMQSKVYIT